MKSLAIIIFYLVSQGSTAFAQDSEELYAQAEEQCDFLFSSFEEPLDMSAVPQANQQNCVLVLEQFSQNIIAETFTAQGMEWYLTVLDSIDSQAPVMASMQVDSWKKEDFSDSLLGRAPLEHQWNAKQAPKMVYQ